jgi:hypothetical protein
MHDRFQTEALFGSKFVYSIDTALQNFFDMVTRTDDLAADGEAILLVEKAK